MDVARIGPSICIKGEIIANEPLTIAGRVDGTIEVVGHAVTLVSSGRLDAIVSAHTIVIDGTVNGNLTADARIVVGETATIEGEVSAPMVSVASGATLHGKVEATGRREKSSERPAAA
jgi:cytoskeletal protein CcmA (bactofilin family)